MATGEEITDKTLVKFLNELQRKTTPFVMIQPSQQVLIKDGVETFLGRIENLTIYEDDVWIATYPKSGTTWTQELVWCLRNNLDFEKAKMSQLDDRIPHLELCQDFPEIDSISQAEKMERPRTIKTHLSYDMLPRNLRNGEVKIINVIRNPRDVCVSYLNHLRIIDNYTGNLETFVDVFTRDYSPPPQISFFKHVLSYWDKRNTLPNLLILTYEEMQLDLPSVIKKVANFLEVTISEEDIPKLCDHLSFDKMKENESVNFEKGLSELKQETNNIHSGSFINKGKTGNWKEKLSADMVQKFKQWEVKWLEDSDLKFTYEI